MATVPKRAGSILVSGSIMLVLALLCGGPLFLFRLAVADLSYRCDEHPPSQTFRRFFQADAPGISDIRATGHISLGGADVFMRFAATPAAIRTFTRGYARVRAEDSKSVLAWLATPYGYWAVGQKQEAGEAHEVHWDELRRIREPEAYEKSPPDNGAQDTLVVDRSRGIAYFYHWNQ